MRCVRYLICCAVALVAGMTALAAPVDSVAARAVLMRFLSSAGGTSLRARGGSLRLAHVQSSAACGGAVADYYVFAGPDNQGFVIVAGDDRAKEILAYGDCPIDVDNVPANVQWLLDQYTEQIEYLFTHPDVQTSAPARDDSTPSVVPPMITTQWGQRTPYRNQCPQVDGIYCVTGCVATGMAQVMNYWKFPSELPALPAYKTSTQKLSVPALPATTVEWDLMRDTYKANTYTEQVGAAVATLMRYCGQSCEMDYTITSSAAWTVDALASFKKFGYDHNATMITRYYFGDEEWNSLILEDLTQGRPVCYVGKGTEPHFFILDGYDGSKYHVNWGWDGLYDAFYELDAMNAGGFKPKDKHHMLHGVFPATEDYDSDYKVDGIYYMQTGETTVAVTCRNKQYNSYSGDVVIPATISFNGVSFRVTTIADNAFRDCAQLTSVQIPESITSIGSRAFDHAGITSIVIPNSVTAMGYSCFEWCSKLEQVEIGSGIKNISPAAFMRCSALEKLVLPSTITSIGENAFSSSGLKSITLPASVVRINDNAFVNCNKLDTVHIDNLSAWCKIIFANIKSNPLTVAHRLFIDGQPLTDITLPEDVAVVKPYAFCGLVVDRLTVNASSLTSIGNYAFYQSEIGRLDILDVEGWLNLDIQSRESNPIDHAQQVFFDGLDTPGTIVLPATMSRVGENAFNGCTWLTSITIPSSIVEIGADAFAGCTSLAEVHIDDLAAWCGITFGNAKANPLTAAHHLHVGNELLTDLCLPDSVPAVKAYAFTECFDLESVALPDSLRMIGEYAFYRCSNLQNVTMGSGLDSIKAEAFGDCHQLNTIICKAKTPPVITDMCFHENTYSNATLYVPLRSVNAYKNAFIWQQFSNIVGVCMTDVEGDMNCDEEVNIADVNIVIDAILDGDDDPDLDVNSDGEINIADVNAVIDMILKGGV